LKPKAVILSGGPASVLDEGSPRAPQAIFDSRRADPRDLLRPADDGRSSAARWKAAMRREFGRADVEIKRSPLFDGVWKKSAEISGLDEPRRPRHAPAAGFTVKAVSENAPFAVAADERAANLHDHVPPGSGAHARRREAAANFVHKVAGLKGDWTMARLPRRSDRLASAPRSARAA
jgi:GMP synthase (glutamine-hydrolysing)